MNRRKTITFRATTNEENLIDLLAKRENRSNSEMIRECIREAAQKRQLLPPGLVTLERLGLHEQ